MLHAHIRLILRRYSWYCVHERNATRTRQSSPFFRGSKEHLPFGLFPIRLSFCLRPFFFFFLSHLLPQEQPSHYQKMKGPVFAAFVFHSLHNNNTNIPPQFAAASNCDRSASPITAPAETALYSGSHQYGPLPACAQTAATRMCNTRIQRASCRVSSPPPLSSRPLPLSVFCCNQTSGFCPKFS